MSYIVPRDIPKNCFECPCCTLGYCRVDVKTTEYAKYVFSDGQDGRHPDCPLVEIPTPHGRLGDLDKLWDRMYNYSDNEGAKMPFGDNDFMIHRDSACELIEDAPTVIEAEGET